MTSWNRCETQNGISPLTAFVKLRIPMMSISHSNLMPIRSERSDAELFQCETVIDISQEFCLFFLS